MGSDISPVGNRVAQSRPRYSGNTGQEFGAALAEQFRPDDKKTRALFSRVQNLDLLEKTTSPPEDRYENNFAPAGDLGFQKEVARLVDRGIIGRGTFVISDTGHDIPMMATLMSRLDMSGALRIPDWRPGDGSDRRVRDQAQTWGNEIQALDARNSADGSVSSYFLGLDGHRGSARNKLDVTQLPPAGDLRAAGVDKIVFLVEAPVGKHEDYAIPADIKAYVDALRKAGFEVDIRASTIVRARGENPGVLTAGFFPWKCL